MHKLMFAALPLFAPALFAQGTQEAAEPNDTIATATVLALGAQGNGAVDLAGDVDLYKVTLTSAGDVRVWLNPGIGASIGDTDLTLFAADGTTQLNFNDDVSGSNNWLSGLTSGGLAAGDYYIRVRASAAFDPTAVGSYTLDVVAAPLGTYAVNVGLSPVTEGAENNDPRPAFGTGTATTSAVFTANSGFVDPPVVPATSGTSDTTIGKDYDYYSFTAALAGSYVLRTTGSAAAPAPVINDTVLHLLDGTFAVLATNDDFGGPYSQITFNIVTPGTYYVSVSGYYGQTSGTPSTGNYVLDILGPTPPLPSGLATVTMQVGGCGGATLGTREVAEPASSTVHTEAPVLGTTFYLDGAGMDANAPAFRVIGVGTGPAFDLGTVGGPAGCNVDVAILSSTFILTDALGQDFWPLSTPANIAFIGLPFEQQIVALDSVDGVIATNRVSSVCGITN